jgi:hypothetical protein
MTTYDNPRRVTTNGATVTDCRHRCCQVRSNPYHAHICAPEGCDECAKATAVEQENERKHDLSVITAAVMRSVVPNIAGLPGRPDLDRIVAERVHELYREALADHQLFGLTVSEWRHVVVVRVGLALAFPHEWPSTGEAHGR